MTTLGELASLIRSKNAGPFELTLDIMFAEEASYSRVLASNRIEPAVVATLFGVDESAVKVHSYPPAMAIKVTVPRAVSVGDPSERDLFGGQMFGPLVNLEID